MTSMHHILIVRKALSIWTCRSFLTSSSRSMTTAISLIWSYTTSSSCFICFLRSMTCICNFSSTNHLTRVLHSSTSMVIINLVFKWSRSYWTSSFENSELLIKYLWVCESLILCWLAKMWGSHDLLRHHQVVRLRSIYSFLALNWSYTITWWLNSTICNLANISNSTDSSRHIVATRWELFDCSWSIRVFTRHFWAVSFEPNHTSTYTHNCVAIMLGLVIVLVVLLLLLSHLTVINSSTSMALVVQPSIHHISLRNLTTTQNMLRIAVHNNIILLDHSDTAYLIIVTFTLSLIDMLLWMTVVLLALHNMTS